MSAANKIALGREQKLFVKKESTFGTLVLPGATDLARVLYGGEMAVQQAEFKDDEQARDSRDVFSRIKGKYQPGDFRIPIYAKPSGTAGTAPDGAALFEAALGKAPSTIAAGLTVKSGSTTTALKVTAGVLSSANIGDLILVESQVVQITSYTSGTDDTIGISPSLSTTPTVGSAIGASVSYKLDTLLPSLSLWFKDGHSVFACAGAILESLAVKIIGNDVASVELAGQYARQYVTGTDKVGTGGVADGVVTTFPVEDLSKFEIGSRFDCESETSIEVTAKSADTGAGNLTVVRGSGAAAHAAGKATTPWIPTGTESGAPVPGRLGKMGLDGASVVFTELNLSLKNGNKMLTDEAGSDYASDYIEGKREVDGSVKIYFRQDDLKHFRNAQTQAQSVMIAQAGNVAGKIMAVCVKKTELNLPAISGNEERELDIPFTGFAGSSNDTVTIAFL